MRRYDSEFGGRLYEREARAAGRGGGYERRPPPAGRGSAYDREMRPAGRGRPRGAMGGPSGDARERNRDRVPRERGPGDRGRYHTARPEETFDVSRPGDGSYYGLEPRGWAATPPYGFPGYPYEYEPGAYGPPVEDRRFYGGRGMRQGGRGYRGRPHGRRHTRKRHEYGSEEPHGEGDRGYGSRGYTHRGYRSRQ